MARFTVKCEVDGNEIARYKFDWASVSKPRKHGGGPIAVDFDFPDIMVEELP